MTGSRTIDGYFTFNTGEEYRRWSNDRFGRIRRLDAWFGQQEIVQGYCDCCGMVTDLRIKSGAKFEAGHNLREGFICPKQLNSRSRLVLRVFNSFKRKRNSIDVALFEDFTRLKQVISDVRDVKVAASIFVGGKHRSGEVVDFQGQKTTFQDITNTSYQDSQFDAVIHCDVLEHVPNHELALKDNFRILRPNGQLIFTAPFFPLTPKSVSLATLDSAGKICHHIDPPEYHGDNISGSVLSYWRFSWDVLRTMERIGFKDCRVIVELDPFSGFLSNNCNQEEGNMTSIAILGMK